MQFLRESVNLIIAINTYFQNCRLFTLYTVFVSAEKHTQG